LIIPIIIERIPVPDLPLELEQIQSLDLSDRLTTAVIRHAVVEIADATVSYLEKDRIAPPVRSAEAPDIAESLAREARQAHRK
jgi:hypothetical protein